jgi:hypothetical protein
MTNRQREKERERTVKTKLLTLFLAFLVTFVSFVSSASAQGKEITIEGIVRIVEGNTVLDNGDESYLVEGIDLSEYEGQWIIITGDVEEEDDLVIDCSGIHEMI